MLLLDSSTITAETQQNIEEIQKQTNFFISYVTEHIPDVISFGIKVVLAIVFFIIGQKVIKFARKVLRKFLEKSSVEQGAKQFLDSMTKYVLYFLLIAAIATNFGVKESSISALIASLGLTVGLALQGGLENFAGGVLILLLKPFVVGDYIIESSSGFEGTVSEIQIFYTKLKTIDNRVVVIPNGSLSNNSLQNLTTQDKRRIDIEVGIAYDADLKKAKQVILDVLLAEEFRIREEEIHVFVKSLEDCYVSIGCRLWVKTEDFWTVKYRITENIKLALDENDIEIPFPQLDVKIKN